MDHMQQRLMSLEKSIRRMRITLLLCISILAGGLILGIAEADRLLRVDKVETLSLATGDISIIDAKGKRRMYMGISKDQSIASIMIYGADSLKPIIALSSSKDGSGASISLADSKGRDKMVIKTDKDNNASVFYFNDAGRVTGGFMNSGGIPVLYAQKVHVTDTTGIPRASLLTDEKDGYQPGLSFFDSGSQLRTRLFFSEKGISGLGFFDKNLKNRGLFGILPQGQAYVLINDSLGKKQSMIPELR